MQFPVDIQQFLLPRSQNTGHSVYLDDCNFHECGNLENFDVDRTITLVRPSRC